ncbi:Cytochrome P450 [Akanthomyces lecanii RCEF 1005]|uniref:Cytochrome P450 n=1 Tax=Akanthomyces lecanii RCEF 1005 TaxID=1081108 RepID=A0A162JJL8_CORDF|nr:Cytochrome P450 [Akanthomyces lecanii RCEF 1005]
MRHVVELDSKAKLVMPWVFCLLWITWVVSHWVYNLFFHPLRKIPGPRLAAMSSSYEFYYDVLKNGLYLKKIKELHEIYGPIIRINPREVHIADPSYYQQIYTSGTRKVEKDPSTVAGFSVPSSVAATVDHFHHRSRRGYINPYFSKRAIVALEPDIHERISALSGRLRQSMLEGGHISLDRSISAMTADIILKRFYGQHYDYVNEPNFEFPIRDGFAGVSVIFHIARFVPTAIQFLRKLPIPVIRCILPKVANFLLLELDISEKMHAILNSEKKQEENSKSVILESLSDERIPAQERTVKRLLDEGLVLTIAGTETSARALSVGIFYMLSNKNIVSRLREEVMNAVPRDQSPDTWTLQQLEPLPFLTGCVKESLRLSFGPVSRLPRVSKEEALQYKEYNIPAGYPVSQSTWLVHTDPSVYPNPLEFDPERWIRAAQDGTQLENFLVNFTKGRRQCLGIKLMCGFEMELWDTSVEDVQIHHARIIGTPKFDKTRGAGQGEIEVKVLAEKFE